MDNREDELFEAVSEHNLQVLDIALEENTNLNFKNIKSQTLLHVAVLSNYSKMVEKLLESSSIDPNLQNNYGETPLHLATQKKYISIIRKLLKNKTINPNLEDGNGRTPLHLAVIDNSVAVVQELLDNGLVNPNLQDHGGKTPLHFAAKNGHVEIVQSLLKNKFLEPDLQDKNGKTPLHISVENNHIKVVEKLLEDKFVNSNLKANDGETPLHLAAEREYVEIIELLLENKSVEPNSQDNYGKTPLHWVAEEGDIEIVKQLLNHPNININLQDSSRKTAFNLAVERENWGISATLIIHGATITDLSDDDISLLREHLQNNIYKNKKVILNGIANYQKKLKETIIKNPRVWYDKPQPEVPTSSASSHQPYSSTLYKAVTRLLAGVHWKWPALYPSWRTTVPPSNPLTLNLDSGQATSAQHSNSLQKYHSGDLQGLLLLVDLAVKKWMGRQYDQPSATPTNALPQAQARLQILLQQQCGDFSSSNNLTADPYKGHRADTLPTLPLPVINS